MSGPVFRLLEEFDRLSHEEQRERLAAIIERIDQRDDCDLTDGDLAALGARMFAMLDTEEELHERLTPRGQCQ